MGKQFNPSLGMAEKNPTPNCLLSRARAESIFLRRHHSERGRIHFSGFWVLFIREKGRLKIIGCYFLHGSTIAFDAKKLITRENRKQKESETRGSWMLQLLNVSLSPGESSSGNSSHDMKKYAFFPKTYYQGFPASSEGCETKLNWFDNMR